MKPLKKLKNIKNEQLDKINFKSDARKARQRKEWSKNREKFLRDKQKCEWCNREPDNFHVHHTWSENFSRKWMNVTDNLFTKSKSYSEDLTNDRQECPNCGKRNYYKRKTKSPDYRCNNCKTEFEDPRKVEGGEVIRDSNYNNKPYSTYQYQKEKSNWVEKNKKQVFEKFLEEYNKMLDKYVSLAEDQVVAICSKCHYKEEKTRKKRCDVCGKNWYNPSKYDDNMCWDCIVSKNGLELCSKCENKWYDPDKYDLCKKCR